jgi:hypothetical protein
MTGDRRQMEGVAVVSGTTERASRVKERFLAAGVSARVLPVQDGPAWPEIRPPLILNTIGMPIEMLVALLANPPVIKRSSASVVDQAPIAQPRTLPAIRATMLREHVELVPIGALADPSDWRTLRLLMLCPAVRLISADDLLMVRRWARHLSSAFPPLRPASEPACLVAPPPPLSTQPAAQSVLRDPFLLPLLAALLDCPTYTTAAMWCNVSHSTLFRTLREVRAALGLPSGDVSRLAPAGLARMILERLSADSPLASQQARQGCDHDSHQM